ncbi:MAG TPA: PEP-CTERM sorting domain-containing protein [Deltaproteobacteria bacterium]|nr:PEP-CTERM sorting domain-containing protein [Deltaproteobacteria bacterium]HQI01161.1 PEP-CTERM sorting domain-containing protein [Deltaproteobacteria bacterium]HQJ09193.1 PEP-CTERM sorting domain-containing protein [Deltaproteobacteria bacterium]
MKKHLFIFVGILVFSLIGSANAVVVTFNDLSAGIEVPDGYGGLEWDQFDTMELPPSSGENIAYNAFNNPALVSSSSLFDFIGASFISLFDDTNTLYITAYREGAEVFNQELALNNLSFTAFQPLNWTGIDALSFMTEGFHFGMDNFEYQPSAPVPEPATLLLLGSGLIGFARLRRKIQK